MLVTAVVLTVGACGAQRKATLLRERQATAVLSLADNQEPPQLHVEKAHRDTLKVTGEDGREVLIMRAIKDENGEMVATDVIQAAMITVETILRSW